MHIKYLPFQQCTTQASDMEAFPVSEHDRQALEIKVGVFDLPSVTMSGISDCLKGKLTFFCCFGADHVFDEHGADDGQFDF